MFWIVMLIAVGGFAFFKLGAYSVLISVLKVGLLASLLTIAGSAILALSRRVIRSRGRQMLSGNSGRTQP